MSEKRKTIKRFIISAVLLFLTGASMLLFKNYPDLFFPWYRRFSRAVMAVLGAVNKFIPVAIWDFGEAALLLLLIISFIRMIVKKRPFFRWLSKVFLVVSVMLFFVVDFWMLNHYGPDLSEELGLSVETYTKEELTEAVVYYRDKAAEAAVLVERDEKGDVLRQDFYELAEIAGKSYGPVGERYIAFEGSDYPVKKLWLTGWYLMYKGFTGEFMPFTGEASVPEGDCPIDMPYVMCHEVAHRLGFAAEEEANFAAFLACSMSDDSRFIYSGYYSAYVYCYNALFKVDRKLASELHQKSGGGYDLLF